MLVVFDNRIDKKNATGSINTKGSASDLEYECGRKKKKPKKSSNASE
jgi:hypothetical protein